MVTSIIASKVICVQPEGQPPPPPDEINRIRDTAVTCVNIHRTFPPYPDISAARTQTAADGIGEGGAVRGG